MKLRPLLRRALTLLLCPLVTLLPCFLVTLSPSLSAQVGKVGINTTTPAAMLHVMDSSVLFTGPATLPANPGPPPVSGPGTRMMWYTDRAAIRAGAVLGTNWDKDSVGMRSSVFGLNGKAKGGESFIGGGNSNSASGFSSFVGGGNSNSASGFSSFVGGGVFNAVSGSEAFVGGGNSNAVSGSSSFVGGGDVNSVSGIRAFLGGGNFNTVSGYNAFIGGGQHLLSKSFGEAVFGLYNTDYTPASVTGFNSNDRLFVIGNGTSTTARSNAVTVLKNGRMGIGTDTPDLLVEMRGDSTSANAATLAIGGRFGDRTEAGRIRFLDGTASTNWRGMYMHHDGAQNKLHIGVHDESNNNTAHDIPLITLQRFGVGGPAPRVGIGTTTPGFLLEVGGDAAKPGGGSWSASSDSRLKTDVAPYTDGLGAVLAIDPVTYRYNDLSGYATEPTHIGVIAQALQEVAPYMVSVSDRVATDGSTGYLAVDNSAMTYMLINAVKEQQAIIEAQQVELSELKRLIGSTGQGIQQDEELAAIKAELANLKALIVGQPAPAGTTAQVAD